MGYLNESTCSYPVLAASKCSYLGWAASLRYVATTLQCTVATWGELLHYVATLGRAASLCSYPGRAAALCSYLGRAASLCSYLGRAAALCSYLGRAAAASIMLSNSSTETLPSKSTSAATKALKNNIIPTLNIYVRGRGANLFLHPKKEYKDDSQNTGISIAALAQPVSATHREHRQQSNAMFLSIHLGLIPVVFSV